MTTDPIIPGFFPDPTICRVDDTYYLATSSFEYLPGIPVHRSTDLTTWTQIGNALTRPEQIAEHRGYGSAGIFAPTLRHHDGQFWLIGTNVNDIPLRRGHFLLHAEDPAGPWSEPVHIPEAIGIDPDIVWDEDGTAHVTWCSLDSEHPGIQSAPVDTSTGTLLAPPRQLWEGSGLSFPEGPHLYRKDDWWYLLLAEGGTERGHTVTIARAQTIDGPYEPAPVNPILSHRSLPHPVQNVGHADLVELPDGSWAAVHLGVRPRGQTPGFHVNGRETFLAGIDWVNGWPVFDEDRFTVPAIDRSFEDRFDSEVLDQRWLGVGRFPSSFSRPTEDGGLLLEADPDQGRALLCTRTTDAVWTATTRLWVEDGTARFSLRLDDRHWYGLLYDGEIVTATVTIGPFEHLVGRWTPAAGDTPALRISAKPPQVLPHGVSMEPDLIELAASDSTGEHVFGEFDGRYLSTEVAGGFTGRVIGVEPLIGQTLLQSFTYTTAPRG
ncbi:glycosyl hydrolase family 43 [Rathayibacter sp. PhB152]|uniref:glycoside hydrolase family 43 protein n=1 Tax=Rathayibacter sp. PhB152 TaxID=2485190 RepID=UPI000F4B0DA5|nr:glycoside hydrolase family 43 protein [Rathayibacter sp. PhB152]ROQ59089.1 glycosyl hydrolase family 43 [Rathayibacter sp. PhB152]